jgi:ankyrin repeat protein
MKGKSFWWAWLWIVTLEYGMTMDAWDEEVWTPLHNAAYIGHLEIVQLLLNYGANANTWNKQCKMGLHLVAQNGHL